MNENKEKVKDRRNASRDSFFLTIVGFRVIKGLDFWKTGLFLPDFAPRYFYVYTYVCICVYTVYI